MTTPLTEQSLAGLPADIKKPGYVRAERTRGIVHIGPGAFHRAHQAVYTDMAMAEASGVHGILVLSGEATSEDVDSSKIKPGLVVSSVAALCI